MGVEKERGSEGRVARSKSNALESGPKRNCNGGRKKENVWQICE